MLKTLEKSAVKTADGPFYIKNKRYDFCMSAIENGTTLVMIPCASPEAPLEEQEWYLRCTNTSTSGVILTEVSKGKHCVKQGPNDYCAIVNRKYHACLDLLGGHVATNQEIGTFSCTFKNNQLFQFTTVSNQCSMKLYASKSGKLPSLCATVRSTDMTFLAFQCRLNDDQAFYLEKKK